MPRFRYSKNKPPQGFDVLEDTLEELDQKMREIENEPHEGKRRKESLWPILRIHHQRTRYVYEMFYKYKAISKAVYDYCLEEKIADAALISKWKKNGYEKLCCLICIQTKNTNFGVTCICRIPKMQRKDGKEIECSNCGCTGCSSTD
ncbi:protein BUD31 homolog [Schistocerca gregaria]|uniref:protein BUD31 homolog n=1 Tax=Schistocerca gregaria TaxID=7010 RepID=UPI00211E9195|nr:protein BUD31 homolog [Schistocerca gregaria]